MDLQLRDKRALVTGSTAGIGFAVAAGLVREGASVIINGRSQERVANAVSRLQGSAASTRPQVWGSRPTCPRATGVAELVEASSRGRHPGEQHGNLRAQTVRADYRRRLVPFLRDERHERRPVDSPLPAGNESTQLGADRLRVERVGRADPQRDDSLRNDQDSPARDLSRGGRDDGRHRRDGQFSSARADGIGGCGDVRL